LDNFALRHPMILIPEIEGTATIRSSAGTFLQAFRKRISAGLLTGRPHPRSNYVVSEASAGHLKIRAADWWTAINVGLNRLELRHLQPGSIHYHVRYWQWAWFALGLSGGLGLIGLALLLSFDVRAYIAQHQNSMIPGLSIKQNLLIGWLMVLFWGFIWPWLLIILHKRPLRGLVARLIAEVDAQAASTAPS
jgi:hypothetical protein